MWHDMLVSGIPWTEKALRTILVYIAIVGLLRWTGKRELAQLNTSDLVVMLLLSNVVQNAIIGPDDSVTGALFGAVVLLLFNAAMVRCSARWDGFAKAFEGTATVLARDGAYDHARITRMGLRLADLDAAVKHQGGDDIAETTTVTLEPGGALLVVLRRADQSADKSDIAALDARLHRIETLLLSRPIS
ncbi:YetF domain-containing protein [Embleya sp. NPDC005575]|uniref:DUF421 domain-containing protein n=1 Tax=Embleya sp. NPDC005575 TaxID=3156892 RepID=UPI0033A10323